MPRKSLRPSGITLVETLAGTVLLGVILAAMLTGTGRLFAGAARADHRRQACQAADEMLARWWLDRDRLPRAAQGPVPQHPGWTWRTQRRDAPLLRRLELEIVCLSIYASDDAAEAARVEVVVPIDANPATTTRPDAR